jgi:recombination protein RecT
MANNFVPSNGNIKHPVTTTNKDEPRSVSAYLNGKIGSALVSNAISDKAKAARFITSLITLCSINPELQNCDKATLVSAALNAETLGLPLNNQMGFGYVLPYKDNKLGRIVAQFQVGWRGLIQLMIRSGQMKRIHVTEVRNGELVKFNPIVNEFEFAYIVNEKERIKAPVIGYYCFFETTNGYVQDLYWTREKMELHAQEYSPGYAKDLEKGTSYTFWSKDFDAMAKKTMLKQISKFAPMSVDLIRAIETDQAVIAEDGSLNYVDGNDNADPVTPKPAVDNDGVVTKEEPPVKTTIAVDNTPEEEDLSLFGEKDFTEELNK